MHKNKNDHKNYISQETVALGSQLDLMATFAELANVPVPNRTLESHSLIPILFGAGQFNTFLSVKDVYML